uniref:Putative secreted protein n=2 Tax=Anopheles triannulatus TaxID=58253 RepID=A0A2M4AAN0_9DIPT
MGLAQTVSLLLPLSIIMYLPAISGAKWFDISLNWKVGYSDRLRFLNITYNQACFGLCLAIGCEQLNWNVFLELMVQKQLGTVPLNSASFDEDTNGTKSISFLDLMLKVDGVRGQS